MHKYISFNNQFNSDSKLSIHMNKYSRIAAIVAALVAGSAVQARPTAVTQTVIRITGSTAFRSAVFNALKNDYFDSTPTLVPSSANASSSQVTFVGTKSSVFGANQVVVETAYSGSVEGLVNVLGTSSSSPVAQPTFLSSGGTNDPVTAADLALSDVAQNTTLFSISSYGKAPEYSADPTNYAGQGIGIVTFSFVANRNSGNLVSNITSDQFQELASNGSLSQGYFTGDNTDSTPVYLTGRYPFSGTRLTVGIVTGLGANSGQVLYSASGSNALTGNDVAQPGSNVGTTWDGTGDNGGGYVSGGSVARVLNNSSQANVIIGYLGLGDVRNAKSTDNSVVQSLLDKLITYNGVTASKANVIAGTYDLWSYERLFGRKTLVTGSAPLSDVTKFVNGNVVNHPAITSNGFIKALDTEIQADLDYVSLTQATATRQADGGVVAPQF